MFKQISNMTKFYCPNKSIYYFFKINTKISTSFRRSMLISFRIDVPGGRVHLVRAPTLQLEKIWFFWRKIEIFHTKYPKIFSHLPSLGAIFLSAPPLTWNPGSAPIDLNMYIINVIADDESKIGLYEIYFLND